MINLFKNLSYNFEKKFRSTIDFSIDNKFPFVKNLRDRGYHFEKNFSSQNKYASKILEDFKKTPNDFLNQIIEESKSVSGRYNYRKYITHFFDEELLLKYANQEIFLDNFRQYFGLEPKIRFISVWLDFPTKDNFSKNSQIFHRDSDDIFLVKSFLCLTKIEKDNGPFEFIEKSHLKPWDMKLKNYLKNNASKQFTADAGDLYIGDTNGFHKGNLITKGYRVLLTVHYVSSKPKVGFLKKIIN